MPLFLVYVEGEHDAGAAPGTRAELTPGHALAIGSGRTSDLAFRITSPMVGRAHALVALLPGTDRRAVVCDLNTTHGTWVKDERVSVAIVSPGEEICIANRFLFLVADEAGPAAE